MPKTWRLVNTARCDNGGPLWASLPNQIIKYSWDNIGGAIKDTLANK